MTDLVVILNEMEAAAILAAACQISAAYQELNMQHLESGDALTSGIDKLEEAVLKGGDIKQQLKMVEKLHWDLWYAVDSKE